MSALGGPPAWLVEAHGDAWHLREFRVEDGVWAVRRERLLLQRAGARSFVAPTWRRLAALLDEAAEFDAVCEARIEACRQYRAAAA